MSMASGAHPGIRELTGRVARAIAIEQVLFEAFGRWIATTEQASAKPVLAAASRRHAWHAELWRERFPLIPDVDVDESVADARSDLDALIAALAVFDTWPSGGARLAVIDVVESVLARGYRSALAGIDPLLDAPTARLLTLVVTDLESAPSTPGEHTAEERLALESLGDAVAAGLL